MNKSDMAVVAYYSDNTIAAAIAENAHEQRDIKEIIAAWVSMGWTVQRVNCKHVRKQCRKN